MAFKLTKEQSARWDELLADAQSEMDELSSAIQQFNEAISSAKETLQPFVDGYNETLTAIKEFVEEIAGEWRGEFDDKSEAWQEGDKGQEVAELIDGLESFVAEDFELPEWEGFEEPSSDDIQAFQDLKPEG